MARAARVALIARRHPGAALLAIALAVLLAHVLALEFVKSRWLTPSVLRPLTTPMLTRLLMPRSPPSPPPPVAAPQPRPKPAATSAPTPFMSEARPPQATPTWVEPTPSPSPVADAPPVSATVAAPQPAATAPPPVPTVTASGPANPSSTSAGTATASYLDAWPADTRLTYRLTGNFRGPVHGDAQVQWTRDDDRYEVRIDVSINLLARMSMVSQGEVTPQGLVPHVYEEDRNGKVASLSFTPTDILYANGTKAPKPAGLQDTASQFVQLTQLFASGGAQLEVGRNVAFWMARFGGMDYWVYDVVDKGMLDIPSMGGAVEVLHLKPRPLANPRGPITAEMWFAPALQYLPVRIRINMGDTTYVDMATEKIEQK